MGKRLTLLIVMALAAGITQAEEYGDIKIVRVDEKGIVFEYHPVNVRLEQAERWDSSLAGEAARRLAIDNCARTASAGNYDLPVRIVLVGIPPDAQPEVTAFAGGENEVAVSNAAKNGRAVGRENLSAADNYALNEEKGGEESRVVPDRPFWIGNQRVLRLKLFPARYDEAGRAYRVAEKIQVEVRLNSLENFVSAPGRNGWERVLKDGLLNYEQAKSFRGRTETIGKLAKAAAFSSPLGQSSNWLKVTFSENGIYRIDRTMLSAAGVPVGSIDPRTIRMFCQGGRVLPAFNNVPRPQWRELAIEVTGEQDGVFDAGDEIHFYGWGVEGWDYDSPSGSFSHAKNNYTTQQVFWFTWGGSFAGSPLRLGSQNVPPTGGPPVVGSFPARFHFEQDRFLAVDNSGEINDYYNWYGGKGTSQTYFFNLPDLTPDIDTVGVRQLSGGILSFSVNGSAAFPIGTSSGLNRFQTGALKTGLNRVDLVLATSGSGFNHFDFLEAYYSRKPVYSTPLLEFETPPAGGPVEFQVSSSPSNFVLWDITNRFLPVFLTGAVRNGSGVLSFDVDATAKQFFALTATANYKAPVLSRQTPTDLTGPNQGDFVLVAPAAFRSALSGYAAHRASQSGLAVRQVDVEQIYNNFSGGLPDPLAIRDFLEFARENWSDPKPRFVLLAGDGTYDFRNLLGTGVANYVPPFIVDQAFDASSNSDEGFLYFGNPGILDSADQFLDMTIARWPVGDVTELGVVADKIRKYEAAPEFGNWRNRVTLVADDEFGLFNTEGFHTQQAEEISSQHLPRLLDQKKIYLFDYPFDGLRQKPEAEEAIVKAWNEGQLVIDYIGHGNPNVWAHERVFKREEDVPRLVNGAKLPLVYAASCDINTFIDPQSDGMGEDLLKDPNGGAIAVIAAVRIVFAGANTDLNSKVFDLLFGADSLSIGEALYLAKLLRQYTGFPTPHPVSNDRRYVLFGDPAMHLARPNYTVRLSVPDSLSALGVTSISGGVVDSSGNLQTGFNGTASLLVFDGLRFKSHPLAGAPDISIPYFLPGNMIYRGEAAVSAGRFQLQFVVPKDISYGSRTGRVSAYAWSASTDAAGFEDSVALSGSAVATSDTVGPKITLTSAGGAVLQPGEPVSVGVPLGVRLEDSSGINITGDPAHTLDAVFDFPSGPAFDLTESFRYEPGSFSRGEAAFSVPSLSPGRHALRIKAWDGANNSAVLELPIEVVSAEKLKLSGVLNYPNPMKEKTNFCYTLSAPADEVVIEIFSLAGRAIRTIRTASSRAGYNFDTIWDGRDDDGDRVASGVYLYKVRARQASKEAEEFGKLVVMR